MALTATAVPNIQGDIISNLRLRSPVVCKRSFDRDNLAITVLQKSSHDGLRSALEPLVQTLKKEPSATIVYAATRNDTETVAQFLQQRLLAEGSKVRVELYHAGLSDSVRHDAHLNFLTGKTEVVVATIAFGMGIDKPDTRRVVHYGPPKSVEEYYQHIGRAGRDGLPAECIMHVSPRDFDKYVGDFYLKDLEGPAREASIQSTTALKTFALNKDQCRRKMILDFFQEIPTFGQRCGTCDNCKSMEKHGDDASRDFVPVAILILEAASRLKDPSKTTLVQVLGGKALAERWKYAHGVEPVALKASLEEKRKNLPRKLNIDQLKEFTTSLVQNKYLREISRSKRLENGYTSNWMVYEMTHLGREALRFPEKPIMLPVPDSIREAERQDELRRQRVLKQLEEKGVQIDKLPREELKTGDGECIRAFTKWHNYISQLQNNGKEDRVLALEELVTLIKEWRSDSAVRNRVAPASILAEHIMYMITYTTATLPRGMRVDKAALVVAGARSRELDSLVEILNSWSDRNRAAPADTEEDGKDAKMVFPPGPTKPVRQWPYAVYKPNKKTGKATWESSYERFTQGESPQAISMAPANGRPIQVITVVGHILDGFTLGREVDLQYLSDYSPALTKSQWLGLEDAERTMKMDVAGDPTTSGADGDSFKMTDLLRPIMGNEFADKPYQDRTDEEKEKFAKWCQALKWYMLLKRAGITPNFEA
jgi:superfamily II DNA helicase RecQ